MFPCSLFILLQSHKHFGDTWSPREYITLSFGCNHQWRHCQQLTGVLAKEKTCLSFPFAPVGRVVFGWLEHFDVPPFPQVLGLYSPNMPYTQNY